MNEKLENFIKQNRKICWESEYENGEYCIGENKVKQFFESNQVQAVVKVNFAEVNKIITESMETAKLEMNASEHPSVYSYFEGQISVLETIQHKLSKISA